MSGVFKLVWIAAPVAGLVLYKLWTLRFAVESRSWPNVTGRVLMARIVNKGWFRFPGDDEVFALQVRYQYTVAGRIYIGTRYSFEDNAFEEYGDAIDALAGIHAGTELPVYYDPKNPRRSILKSVTLFERI